MPPEPWYLDDADTSYRVLERIVHCIDAQTRLVEDELLTGFLLAAWPSAYAQLQ